MVAAGYRPAMFAGIFDSFFGVPMHPFAVHAPIVLLPITAIVAIVFAVRADWRTRAAWGMPAAVLVLVGMLVVAKESGESALESGNVFGNVQEHQQLADQTFIVAIVWLVAAVALYARDRQMSSNETTSLSAAVAPSRDPLTLGLSIVTAVIAVVAMVWLIRTGHAGSASRWDV